MVENKTINARCSKCGKLDKMEVQYYTNPKTWFEKLSNNAIDTVESGSSGLCDDCWQTKNKEDLKEHARRIAKEETDAKSNFELPSTFKQFDRSLTKDGGAFAEKVWRERVSNLYIWGEYGTGKTRSAANALYQLMRQGYKCAYLPFNEMMNVYTSIVMKSDKQVADAYLKSILKYDYVLIDDFAKKRLSDSNCEAVYQFFEYLYSSDTKAKVWITANSEIDNTINKWADKDLAYATFSRFQRVDFLTLKN